MKRILAGIALTGATLLSLTACGTPAPAPTVTVTTTVTPPAAAPLAELHYTPGGSTTVSFTVPADGYVLQTNCTDTAGSNHLQYTESNGTGFGGTDAFACTPEGAKDVHVESAEDAKDFSLVGTKLTIDLGDAANLNGIKKVDLVVKSLDF